MALPRPPTLAGLEDEQEEPLLLREGVRDFRPRRTTGWRSTTR